MRKYICIGLMFALVIAPAFAGNVEEVTSRQGWTTVYEMKDSLNALATGGTLTNGLTVTGVITSSGESVLTGGQSSRIDGSVATALVVTNGQTVTLSGPIQRWNVSGGADDGTNTITILSVTAGELMFVINTGTSNDLAIAQSGSFKSAAIELAPAESAWFAVPVTNAIYAIQE